MGEEQVVVNRSTIHCHVTTTQTPIPRNTEKSSPPLPALLDGRGGTGREEVRGASRIQSIESARERERGTRQQGGEQGWMTSMTSI